MALWKLSPKAHMQDPHWLGHSYKKPILVEADSAAEARVKAAHWERRYITEHYGNESAAGRSAFEDEKLYGSLEISSDLAATEEGEETVIIH